MTDQTTAGLNLIIPDKPDIERDALADSFKRRGGVVQRLARFWDPPFFSPATVRVYGPDAFCLVLQQKLGFSLRSPPDDLLAFVPASLLRRRVVKCVLAEALSSQFPVFVKPLAPKLFRSAVYSSRNALDEECRGLAVDTPVWVAEPVNITCEVRSFVLDRGVLDAAIYEGGAEVADAMQFIQEVARAMTLPNVVVIDIGFVAGRGWAVIEFNAAWGAGLNGCDPDKILPAILAASGN